VLLLLSITNVKGVNSTNLLPFRVTIHTIRVIVEITQAIGCLFNSGHDLAISISTPVTSRAPSHGDLLKPRDRSMRRSCGVIATIAVLRRNGVDVIPSKRGYPELCCVLNYDKLTLVKRNQLYCQFFNPPIDRALTEKVPLANPQ
jgi:hypothetical protein